MAKRKQKQRGGETERERVPVRSQAAPAPVLRFEGDPRRVRGLPAGRNAHPLRRALLLRSQKQAGNRATGRLVLRQAEEEEPMDAARLGVLEEELEGHAQRPLVQRQNGGSPPPQPAPTANITLNVNPPTVVRLPAATIASNHGKPGVAGWTTPAYTLNPTNITASRIDITVTLDFRIELASEYSGATLDVLRDHEQGHVQIGREAARAHFVEWMGQQLEALPRFSVTPPIRGQIRSIFLTAGRSFAAEEAAESQGYDAADYPRMREAYLGARTPLADLEATSPPIGDLVGAMADLRRQVLTASGSADEEAIAAAAQQLLLAQQMLAEVDVTRLQYNPAFKVLVGDLWHVLDQAAELLSPEGPAWSTIGEVRTVLATFEWTPTV